MASEMAAVAVPSIITTSLIVVTVIFPLLATATVALRFHARNLSEKEVHAEDWVIVAALILTWASSVNVWISGSILGINDFKTDGYPASTPPAMLFVAAAELSIRTTWIDGFMLGVTLALTKISILLFYKNIFVTRKFRFAVWAMVVVISGWAVSTVLTQLFMATPTTDAWNVTVDHYNIDYDAFYLAVAGMSLCFDVIVLCFPLPVIWRLQMPNSRKVYIAGIFWLGAFLDYQHWLMTRLCGFLLHPSIPHHDSFDLRIADLAEELPQSVQIDAFDIGDEQFPAPGWVPANIRFSTHDCYRPFPHERLGVYGVVHLRFFLTNIAPGGLEPLIGNLMTLLKPGGYLQWVDPDMDTTTVVTAPERFATPAVDKLVSVMKKPMPDSDHSFVARLGDIFTQQGLDVVAFDRYPMRDALRPFFCHTQIMGYEAFCEKLEEQGMEERAREGRKHVLEVRREFGKGAALAQEFVCCVGRKKL